MGHSLLSRARSLNIFFTPGGGTKSVWSGVTRAGRTDRTDPSPPPRGRCNLPRAAIRPIIAALESGDSVELTRAVQRELKAKGYETGVVDGVAGLVTRAAIMAYEADHGLTLTASRARRSCNTSSSAAGRPRGRAAHPRASRRDRAAKRSSAPCKARCQASALPRARRWTHERRDDAGDPQVRERSRGWRERAHPGRSLPSSRGSPAERPSRTR